MLRHRRFDRLEVRGCNAGSRDLPVGKPKPRMTMEKGFTFECKEGYGERHDSKESEGDCSGPGAGSGYWVGCRGISPCTDPPLDRPWAMVGAVVSPGPVPGLCSSSACPCPGPVSQGVGGGALGEKAHAGRTWFHHLQGCLDTRLLGEAVPVRATPLLEPLGNQRLSMSLRRSSTGKGITSLMSVEPVSTIKSRSMPKATPAASGMPL